MTPESKGNMIPFTWNHIKDKTIAIYQWCQGVGGCMTTSGQHEGAFWSNAILSILIMVVVK